jgi:hypothetical protein
MMIKRLLAVVVDYAGFAVGSMLIATVVFASISVEHKTYPDGVIALLIATAGFAAYQIVRILVKENRHSNNKTEVIIATSTFLGVALIGIVVGLRNNEPIALDVFDLTSINKSWSDVPFPFTDIGPKALEVDFRVHLANGGFIPRQAKTGSPSLSGTADVECDQRRDAFVFSEARFSPFAGEEINFNWDVSQICLGTSIENSEGMIAVVGEDAGRFRIYRLPGLWGRVSISFEKPGSYVSTIRYNARCNNNGRKNVCTKEGTVTFRVR